MAEVEYLHCDVRTIQRVIRILADVTMLGDLNAAQLLALYDNLEEARDALSRLLDRADKKHAGQTSNSAAPTD